MANKKEHFFLQSTYVIKLEDDYVPIYLKEDGEQIKIETSEKCSFNNAKMIPFKEFIEEQKFIAFLYSKNGKIVKSISKKSIIALIKIIKIKKTIPDNIIEALTKTSYHYASIISELLGLNYFLNSQSKVKIYGNIDNIIVEGCRVNKFKETLASFILSSLIVDKNVNINECHNRVIIALKSAGIKITDRLLANHFMVNVSRKHITVLSGPEVVFKEQNGQQYIYKKEIA